MMFHKVSIPNPDSTIKAEILPSDESSELTVYFRYNESPSLTEYDFKTTFPHQDYAMGNYTLFMSRDQMKGAGDYYIGVLPRARDNEPIETSINYTFDVISSACYFWDDTSLDWSSKGCQVNCLIVFYLYTFKTTAESESNSSFCNLKKDEVGMFQKCFVQCI